MTMTPIDIQITKATIKSFTVDMGDVILPHVTATIALWSPNGKEISSFTVSTYGWHNMKIEMPVQMIDPITQIARQFERIVTNECVKQMCLISAGSVTATEVNDG
jgi:hypothetical protein